MGDSAKTFFPIFSPDSGFGTYYPYDGNDVALTVTKALGGGYNVSNRYMVGGIDDALVGRITGNAGTQNLALVSDYQGSSVSAIKRDASVEQQAVHFTRSAFGMLERSSGTGGGSNSQTGYTGASTPNATSGFTYLRNRWYDPQTGRFLTQDPIGLAGGVNLYSYAGNNPIAFTDPFGLAADSIRFVSADEAKFNSAVGKMRTCLKSCDYLEAVKAGFGLAILDAAKSSTKNIYIRMQTPASRDISEQSALWKYLQNGVG